MRVRQRRHSLRERAFFCGAKDDDVFQQGGAVQDLKESRAMELRRAFDETFTRPVTQTVVETEAMLAIQVGADPFALRVLELAGLARSGKIVAVPSAMTSLLGIMEYRGG